MNKFPCLKYGLEAAETGGTLATVINAADEIAVRLFLDNKIKFPDISNIIEQTMRKHKNVQEPTLEEILKVDTWAREAAMTISSNLKIK
jgi:1-deoxy-D-xylulose-5-phosphate reductoisomerase